MELPKLYNRNSKGQIKEWSIVVEEGASPYLIIKHGLVGYKIQEDIDGSITSKNEGKSNATTPMSQAVLEAKSRWNKKRNREGYKTLEDLKIDLDFYKIEKTEDIIALLEDALPKSNELEGGIILPMKCQPYKGKMKFPVYTQPKLNGFRCTVSLEIEKEGLLEFPKVVFRGKTGIEILTVGHIAKEFQLSWFGNDGEIVFDGELYIHGMLLQDISSASRKFNTNTKKLEFHVFDLAIPNVIQLDRTTTLESLIASTYDAKFIHIVETKQINTEEEAQAFCDYSVHQGYEGAIFRDKTAMYAFGKRPKTIQKLKRFKDGEFTILDITTDSVAEQAVLLLKNDVNDLTFKSTPEGSFEYRAELLLNKEKYIGKLATVQYFERTRDKLPFHTKVVNIDRTDG